MKRKNSEPTYKVKDFAYKVVLEGVTQFAAQEYLLNVRIPGMYSVVNEKTGQKFTGRSFLEITKTKVL